MVSRLLIPFLRGEWQFLQATCCCCGPRSRHFRARLVRCSKKGERSRQNLRKLRGLSYPMPEAQFDIHLLPELRGTRPIFCGSALLF